MQMSRILLCKRKRNPWIKENTLVCETHFSNVIITYRHKARSFCLSLHFIFHFSTTCYFSHLSDIHTAIFFLHIFQTTRKLTQVVSDIKMKNKVRCETTEQTSFAAPCKLYIFLYYTPIAITPLSPGPRRLDFWIFMCNIWLVCMQRSSPAVLVRRFMRFANYHASSKYNRCPTLPLSCRRIETGHLENENMIGT